MSKDSSKSSGKSGNTKQISPAKHWCFTFNNYSHDDILNLVEKLSSIDPIKYVFQEELGKEDKTPHLQGLISFPKKVRPKNMFNNKIHWEKCKNLKASIAYCQKSDTRNGKVFLKGYPKIRPLKIIEKLKPWQANIVNLIQEDPDDRSIHWYWDEIGNIGKTVLCRYLVHHYSAFVASGKIADIKYGIVEWINKNGAAPEIILLDIPRINQNYVSWAAIEKVKDGLFFSGKYESKMVIYNPPHVICFSNFEPDVDIMSKDRWKITNLRH